MRLFRRMMVQLAFCLAVLLSTALLTHAADVGLAWNASNPDTFVAGYMIHYGQASGAYAATVDVGKQLTARVTNLTPGTTYFFAATAYNAQGKHSGYSNEVSYEVPLPIPAVPGELKIVITVVTQ